MRAVLLPGMDGTGELLTEFEAALAPDFEVTIIPYPRDVVHGYSELIARVRDVIPRSEPFVIVAESFSGPIAISLASERPPGLSGLVLCASFARSPWPRLGKCASLLRLLPLQRLPAWFVMPILMGRWKSPRWSDRVSRAIRTVDADVIYRRLRDAGNVDVSTVLPNIECPVLYLKASGDRVVPSQCWQVIRAALPTATCIEIEGPHFLLQAQPEASALAVREWFCRIA